jgi:hypothetical protein
LVAIKATGERLSGKQENNGIYLAAEDTLIRRVAEPDTTLLDKNIQHLRSFAQQSGVPVYFGLIPTAASVWKNKLPADAPTADEDSWTQWLYNRSGAENIDLASPLHLHSDEAIYFRTDHHWTSLGAYYGANAILHAMGLDELKLSEYTEKSVSDNFLGTNYSSAGAWWAKPDTITTYVPDGDIEVVSNFTGREEPGNLYVPSHLEGKNKYAYFLGGNQPLCVIQSPAKGPKIMIIRDSYADCLAPFLAERFQEVHLYDLRYNRLRPAEYIQAHEIDLVLVLYGFESYITDENQFLLTR